MRTVSIEKKRGIRSVRLSIKKDGVVKLVAPSFVSDRECEEFLRQKSSWIEKNLLQIMAAKNMVTDLLAENSGRTLMQGIWLPVAIKPSLKKAFEFDGALIALKDESKLKQFYKEQAYNFFEKKTAEVASFYGAKISSLCIREQKRRWGSCSSQGKLSLNAKLIKAPRHVAEYVVVHEVCHLLHLNHSKAFYAEIAKLLPEFKRSEEWLKRFGELLHAEQTGFVIA